MSSFSREELAILSTLAYYQALGVPSLTTMEILRFWTPRGKDAAQTSTPNPSFLQVKKCLDALAVKGIVQTKNGYAAFSTDSAFFEKRIAAKKYGVIKRKICLRFTRLLPYVPFVRMMALTGSLAVDNADEQSDIDILVGSERNRIWTTRILVTTLFQILGKRRHGNKIKNRICLNHYVALSGSENPRGDFRFLPEALTTAHIYAQAIPLWDNRHFSAARDANPWMYAHVALPLAQTLPAASSRLNRFGTFFKKSLEVCLHPLWLATEKMGGSLQKKHILKKIAGRSVDPLEVLVGDSTLLFHYPFSRSKYALARYEKQMKSFAEEQNLSHNQF